MHKFIQERNWYFDQCQLQKLKVINLYLLTCVISDEICELEQVIFLLLSEMDFITLLKIADFVFLSILCLPWKNNYFLFGLGSFHFILALNTSYFLFIKEIMNILKVV
jgi:hypothetical protein